MAKKRERLEVIHDMLSVVRNNKNSIGPTRLLRFSNLSNQMFKEYTDELTDKGFLQEMTEKKGKRSYSLTEKGFKFLQEYQVITGFIQDFGL
ncbi:hypothetical protein GOV07_03580 [Candidatus Woesearchaeota archaeon]|nr:hypothetical protein [Candidatus Woesearchaeota archaeon]